METPERVAAIRQRLGLRVMKALGIRDLADLSRASDYIAIADRLLLDAKPPKNANRPGGLGQAFDWRLLDGFNPGLPYLLAGGLNPDNVAEAIRLSGAHGVDVSSGVEVSPGEKDPDLIRSFIDAARRAVSRNLEGVTS
jgi:phosphoribosylanthranilate isomerase